MERGKERGGREERGRERRKGGRGVSVITADDVIIVVLKALGCIREMKEANRRAVKYIMETK